MLSIVDRVAQRTCRGLSRREFLRIGSLACGGLALPQLLAARQAAAATGKPIVTGKSVVFLFLQGGPSHIEFFDPKMTAPVEIRSTTGEVSTRLPGITFGGTFPRLAQLADRLTVVRSYGSGNNNHTYQQVASGGNPTKAAMGAIFARIAGPNHPRTGLPNNVLLLPEAIEPDLPLKRNFESEALPTLTDPGKLGPAYGAFAPGGGGQLQQNMELRLPRERFTQRRALLVELDRLRRQVDASKMMETADHYQQQAFEVIARGVGQAFDLSQEDSRTIARYDTRGLFRNAEVQRYNDMYRSTNLLGMQMLMARRLVEAGCGFITVADAGWDMHGNRNSLPGLSGMEPLGRQVDHAVAAFLEDVAERGLSEWVLLVITGEMGRTPRINGGGGRDHYGELTPLALAGGGLATGQVIGQSDGQATRAATEPYRPRHMLATIMHTLFDVGELRLASGVPTELLKVATEGEPIPGLLE